MNYPYYRTKTQFSQHNLKQPRISNQQFNQHTLFILVVGFHSIKNMQIGEIVFLMYWSWSGPSPDMGPATSLTRSNSNNLLCHLCLFLNLHSTPMALPSISSCCCQYTSFSFSFRFFLMKPIKSRWNKLLNNQPLNHWRNNLRSGRNNLRSRRNPEQKEPEPVGQLKISIPQTYYTYELYVYDVGVQTTPLSHHQESYRAVLDGTKIEQKGPDLG